VAPLKDEQARRDAEKSAKRHEKPSHEPVGDVSPESEADEGEEVEKSAEELEAELKAEAEKAEKSSGAKKAAK